MFDNFLIGFLTGALSDFLTGAPALAPALAALQMQEMIAFGDLVQELTASEEELWVGFISPLHLITSEEDITFHPHQGLATQGEGHCEVPPESMFALLPCACPFEGH